MKQSLLFLSIFIALFSCKRNASETKAPTLSVKTKSLINYSKNFDLQKYNSYTKLIIKTPFPGSDHERIYYLIPDSEKIPDSLKNKTIIRTPVKHLVATSTTHIPMIELFDREESLAGFPQTQYISSERTLKRVESGKVKELGNTEDINTEILLDLKPEVVIGFSLGSNNKMYKNIESFGIPVIFNAEWLEQDPLGRAEWLKLFGALYQMEDRADSLFKHIEKEYLRVKNIARKAESTPSVLTGSLFNDKWDVPAGESFMAILLNDANTNYLWKGSKGTGSLVLSLESVLAKAADADLWIGAGSYTSYKTLEQSNEHYKRFKAFKNKKVYTFSKVKGTNGGVIYFEQSPVMPHIVLSDLIKVAHPELLPDYNTYFLKELD